MTDKYEVASELYREGRFEEAIEVLQSIRELKAQRWEIYDKLADCYKVIGNLDEGEAYFTSLLRDHPTDNWARIGIGKMRFLKGSPLSALRLIEEAESGFRNSDDELGIAHCEFYRLYIKSMRGHLEGVFQGLESLVGAFRRLGDDMGLLKTLSFFGSMRELHGECAQALALFEEALSIADHLGNYDRKVVILVEQGLCYRRIGNQAMAESLMTQAFSLSEQIKAPLIMILSLRSLADMRADAGDYEHAMRLISEAQALSKKHHFTYSECQVLISKGRILLNRQDFEQASETLEIALKMARSVADTELIIQASLTLARLSKETGQLESARYLAHEAVLSLEEMLTSVENDRVKTGIRKQLRDVYVVYVSILDELGDSIAADPYRVYL